MTEQAGTETTIVDTSANATTGDNATTTPEPWYLMEGVPGTGARPEFLEPKYKSMAEQAKAYKELQKAFGATAGAPEEYDFGDYKEVVDVANPHIQDFIQYAKGNRLNQEAFSKALTTFVNYEKSRAPNMDEEVAKLGTNGGERIETVRRWAENNLSDKAIETIGKIGVRADVIEFLDEVRQYQHHNTSQPPVGDASSTFKPMSVAEVEAELAANYKEYCDNPVYRKKITSMFEQAVG